MEGIRDKPWGAIRLRGSLDEQFWVYSVKVGSHFFKKLLSDNGKVLSKFQSWCS